MTLSLPPFTRAVTWLIGINTGVFLLMELFGMARLRGINELILDKFELLPNAVVHHGQVLYWNFDRHNFGLCHVRWRRRGVCRPPGRIAVRLAVRAARAETGAGRCGDVGALLRLAQFVPSLEAAAGGEKV